MQNDETLEKIKRIFNAREVTDIVSVPRETKGEGKMPDASELNVAVQADVDVKDGDIVTIAGAGEIVEIEDRNTKEVRKRLRLPLKLVSGDVKELTLNGASNKNLMAAFGKHTEDWVGKTATVTIVSKDVFGQIKRVIYLMPIR